MGGETLESVVAALGEHLGLGTIELDESGACALAIDDDLVVHMARDDGEGRAVLYAPLGDLPATHREATLDRLLQANALSWAVMALAPATGQPVVLHRFALRDVDRHKLELLLERFIGVAREWRGLLETSAADGPPADAADPMHHLMRHGIRA